MGSFGTTVGDLRSLVESRGKDFPGGIGEIANVLSRDLHVNLAEGLDGDCADLSARRRTFGRNVIPPKLPKTFLELVWEALHDTTLIILVVAAVVSLVLGLTVEEEKDVGWIEGFAILMAVVVVVLVTAFNDYSKEKQFRGLQQQIVSEMNFTLLRGGHIVQVPTADIVVGDVVVFKYGDKLPADGVFFQGHDVRIDESSLTGEADLVKKSPAVDVMCLSGTQVMEGSGRMVVTAVGLNSQSGIIFQLLTGVKPTGTQAEEGAVALSRRGSQLDVSAEAVTLNLPKAPTVHDDVEDEEDGDSTEKSVLQDKLTRMAIQIGYAGTVAATLSILVLLMRFIIEEFAIKGRRFNSSTDLSHLLEIFIIGVTVLVVAVPEGLPLAVTISLAYSVKKMMADHNMVRHLHACETMGNATAICSDKTGTLTTNRMTVVKSYLLGGIYEPMPEQEVFEGAAPVLDIICEGIALNSSYSSQLLPSEQRGCLPRQVGNTTECALLGFVKNLGRSYIDLRQRNPVDGFVKVFTFNSDRKSMSTIVCNGSTDSYRLFCKGASEIVLRKCTRIVGVGGAISPLTSEDKEDIVLTVIERMASEGLRTICLASRDFSTNDLAQLRADSGDGCIRNNVDLFEDEHAVVSNLTCLAIVGIEDPVRPEVPLAIEQCHRAGIVVRMVTGDNESTARAIAIKCGIFDPSQHHLVLTGKEFRERVHTSSGSVKQQALDRIWPHLRVLARSSPTDKHTLVKGIIESTVNENREVVAVTGEC